MINLHLETACHFRPTLPSAPFPFHKDKDRQSRREASAILAAEMEILSPGTGAAAAAASNRRRSRSTAARAHGKTAPVASETAFLSSTFRGGNAAAPIVNSNAAVLSFFQPPRSPGRTTRCQLSMAPPPPQPRKETSDCARRKMLPARKSPQNRCNLFKANNRGLTLANARRSATFKFRFFFFFFSRSFQCLSIPSCSKDTLSRARARSRYLRLENYADRRRKGRDKAGTRSDYVQSYRSIENLSLSLLRDKRRT